VFCFVTFIGFRRSRFELTSEQIDSKFCIASRAMHPDFATGNSDTPASTFRFVVPKNPQCLLMVSGLSRALNGNAINEKVGHITEFPKVGR
jgi:hypothetical protein